MLLHTAGAPNTISKDTEGIDHCWIYHEGVAKGQRLSGVVEADTAGCQKIVRIDRVRECRLNPRDHIARK